MAREPKPEIVDMVVEYDEIGQPADPDPVEAEDIEDDVLKEVLSQLRQDVEDAIDLFESEFEPDISRAQKYFNGESDLPQAAANRSKYVHTKVRDTIRAMKPDIMRTLVGTPWPVEFIPPTAEIAAVADIQTKYVTQLFHRLGGYKTIYDAAHTACLHRLGVVKAFYDERRIPRYACYNGIDQQQLQLMQDNPDVQVVIDREYTEDVEGPNGPETQPRYDVDVIEFENKGRAAMHSIPPEDFFIDEWATSAEDFRVIGHRRNVTISDGVAMGFDKDELAELDALDPEVSDAVEVSERRRKYQIKSKDGAQNKNSSQRRFLLTEAYTWADLDNIGVAQLYRFWLGGTKYKYLDHERVDDHPFALFAIDPEPFAVYGTSIYDITHTDQDVMTSLARAIVDNAHMSNAPRLAVHETLVNMEDVLNNEVGAVIRVRAVGQVQPVTVPFTGGQLIPLMQYLDASVDNKTGITRASVGLDPDAMQSTDKEAVQNTIAKQAGQVELAVRNLAETGLKRLFRMLLKLTLENPNPVKTMRVAGGYVPAPLDLFDPEMDMEVAVGTGTSGQMQQIAALQQVKMEQDKIIAQFGPGNPVVSLTQMFNTIQDGLALMGMKNVQRYFTPVTPEIEQALKQEMEAKAASANQQPPDPAQALLQAEQIKAQTKMQTDQMRGQIDISKAAAQHRMDMTRLRAEYGYKVADGQRQDDLARDKMLQDMWLKLAEIEAKLGVQIHSAELGTEIQRDQMTNQTQMQRDQMDRDDYHREQERKQAGQLARQQAAQRPRGNA